MGGVDETSVGCVNCRNVRMGSLWVTGHIALCVMCLFFLIQDKKKLTERCLNFSLALTRLDSMLGHAFFVFCFFVQNQFYWFTALSRINAGALKIMMCSVNLSIMRPSKREEPDV